MACPILNYQIMKFINVIDSGNKEVSINTDNILCVIDEGNSRTIYLSKDVVVKTHKSLGDILLLVNQS